MTGQPTVSQLVDLANAFNQAAYTAYKKDPVFMKRLHTALTPYEVVAMENARKEVEQAIQTSIPLLKNRNPAVAEEMKTKIDASTLKICEIFANVLCRLKGGDALAAFVPASARTAANRDGFQVNKAPALADLFAPKAP